MKLILSLAFIVSALAAKSTVHTVSNNPAKPAQYSTINEAIAASTTGDTIYVHGSPNLYNAVQVINKKLIFIGPGFQPDKVLPYPATIQSGINLIGDLCSGSEFHGLVFTGSLAFQGCDSLKFIRNYFGAQREISLSTEFGTYRDIEFAGNYFHTNAIKATYPISNLRFVNNTFFRGNITGLVGGANMLFDHNVFYGPQSGSLGCFGNSSGMVLTNNVFLRRDAGTGTSQCIFSNNITWLAGEAEPWLQNQNADAGGNLANQSPQITDQTQLEAGIFGLLHNYSIAAGPANNAGSDGKDMGLLFDDAGLYNWSRGRNSTLPFIYNMTLANPTIETGGNLSITIEAKANN